MNDPKLGLQNLSRVIEASSDDLSFTEKAGLYGALNVLIDELGTHVDEYMEGHAYAHENLEKVRWSAAAALGFDITNGHGSEAHRVWAFGALSTLESIFAANPE